MIKIIDKLTFNFLWGCKTDKIKRDVVKRRVNDHNYKNDLYIFEILIHFYSNLVVKVAKIIPKMVVKNELPNPVISRHNLKTSSPLANDVICERPLMNFFSEKQTACIEEGSNMSEDEDRVSSIQNKKMF